MATVQLTDLIYGANFEAYTTQKSVRLNAFAAAGVLVRDPLLDAMASNGQGFTFNMPSFGRVANDEPNASTDDPSDVAVPKAVTTLAEIARKLMRNQGWSSSDLASALISRDPLEAIGDQLADYWAGVNQTTLIKMCLGILADNVTNDGGDMVYDVATDDAAAISDAERFSDEAMISAAQTLGDHKGSLVAIAVHSAIHARMQRLGALIDHYDPQNGTLQFQSYQGKRVIVDDDMPAVAGSNRTVYTSILFGAGAFAYGMGTPKTPTAVEREEAQGNGEGVETLWNRRHEIIHPRGFAVAGTQASAVATPTYSYLASAAAWNRVFTRKLIPLAFVQTNG
jgi:hypothetical protein